MSERPPETPDVAIRCPNDHIAHPTFDPVQLARSLDTGTAAFFCPLCSRTWPIPHDLYGAFREWFTRTT